MTKHGRVALLAMILMSAPVSEAMCGGDVLFLYGSRSLDSDAEPVDDQDAYGVTAFFKKPSWPISLALGYESSKSGTTDLGGIPFGGVQIGSFEGEGSMIEGYLGVGKVWDKFGSIRPFVGGGFTVIGVEFNATELITNTDFDDDDTLIAPYLNTGVFWRVGKSFNVGIGLRYVFFAEVVLFDQEEADVNYLQYSALIGWGW